MSVIQFLQFSQSYSECLYDIKLSLFPCIKNVGERIFYTIFKLSNYSETKTDKNPNFSYTTFLIDVYELYKITAPGERVAAKCTEGPDPIDQP